MQVLLIGMDQMLGQYGLLPVLWLLGALSLIAALLEQPWQRC